MFEKEILDIFKVMLVDKHAVLGANGSFLDRGFVTNFKPTISQEKVLLQAFRPLDITTLFSVEERKNADISDLLLKQVLHYIEVYGLNSPGLFDLEVTKGKVITLTYVRGVTLAELSDMIRKILYTNAPVKDAEVFKSIIQHFDITYDINEVKNNELRVSLFDVAKHVFKNGDDAVRYICYNRTGESMLIKSTKVLDAVKNFNNVDFLTKHERVLAQVFNRHKAILMSVKNRLTKSAINRISRLSKTLHVPVSEPLSKRFVAEALNGQIYDFGVLDKMSVRDKFKFLNLLEFKKMGNRSEAYIVRNGKIHLKEGVKTYDEALIDSVMQRVLASLAKDLAPLKSKTILLDKNVDYGLPVSRKQTMGNLPYGTMVFCSGDNISSGIYWENEGGARDLDLAAIDKNGHRTGWGQYSGYDRQNPIVFSGDVTSAPKGAMEFMTSKKSYKDPYGLYVNIFNGEIGAKAYVVVGHGDQTRWMSKTFLKEEVSLKSRGNIIGFVKNGTFVLYSGRLSGLHISGSKKDAALVSRGLAEFWTIQKLFRVLGINFELDKDSKKVYDHSLSYSEMTYDKLENLFGM